MEQGINRVALYKGMARRRMPVGERVYVKDTHEPIVEREVFDKVKRQREKDSAKFKSSYGMHDKISKEPNLLKGILVCGDCGKNMPLWRDRSGAKLDPPRVYYKYICRTYQMLKEKGCSRKRLDKKEVEKAVEEGIRMHIKLFLDNKMLLERLNRSQQTDGFFREEIREAVNRKKRAEKMSGSLYNDYADGILSESDYLYAKEKYLKEIEAEGQRISELQAMEKRHRTGCSGESRLDALVQKYKDFESLTEEIIHSFVSRVLVYGDERLEIEFRFKDEFEELLEVVEERGGGICRKEAQAGAADM